MDKILKLQEEIQGILSYTSNKPSIAKLLNTAIADEFLAVYQYLIGSKYLKDQEAAKEFRDHAMDEYSHAEDLIEMLNSMNENVVVCPKDLMRFSHCGFEKPIKNDALLLQDNIKSEECAVKFYTALHQIVPDEFKEKIQKIIDDEKEHVEDIKKHYERVYKNSL
jgi:bacterioferritin